MVERLPIQGTKAMLTEAVRDARERQGLLDEIYRALPCLSTEELGQLLDYVDGLDPAGEDEADGQHPAA